MEPGLLRDKLLQSDARPKKWRLLLPRHQETPQKGASELQALARLRPRPAGLSLLDCRDETASSNYVSPCCRIALMSCTWITSNQACQQPLQDRTIKFVGKGPCGRLP